KLTFYGGAETTTGSMHLLEVEGSPILLDCGLFQGNRKKAYELNRNLPFNAAKLDTVLLSHAHIDHSGNLPSLHKNGFTEKVFCTHATRDLASVMLKDSAYIQVRDAEYLRKRGKKVYGPLYDVAEAELTIWHFAAVNYRQPFRIHPQIKVEFFDAGHVLGSALTKLHITRNGEVTTVVYAVDLGRKDLPILRNPQNVGDADYLILESTYGGRYHSDINEAGADLAEIVNHTYKRGGKLIIPAFSLERTQELVYVLRDLKRDKEIPDLPIYIDSPLAVNITDIFRLHPECFDDETNELLAIEEDPLGGDRCHYVRSVEASKRLNHTSGSHIIISASGMCEAGRILHHLLHNVENPNNTVLFVGYQAEHTLGRRMVDGAKEIRVFGDLYKMNAEVVRLDSFSAHADENDLVDYVAGLHPKPKQIFLVHGEQKARTKLHQALGEKLHIDATLPHYGETFEL
ncbi:MAG: MBL fold metallo-hydrolase, partial [candidate division Zixibacteria bacterium]|nr:MBL fold metallo-hydrolase [candidate division Zixibacteria bacterium]